MGRGAAYNRRKVKRISSVKTIAYLAQMEWAGDGGEPNRDGLQRINTNATERTSTSAHRSSVDDHMQERGDGTVLGEAGRRRMGLPGELAPEAAFCCDCGAAAGLYRW